MTDDQAKDRVNNDPIPDLLMQDIECVRITLPTVDIYPDDIRPREDPRLTAPNGVAIGNAWKDCRRTMSFTDLYGSVLRLVEHGQAVDEAVDTLDIIEAQATILYVTHASSGVKGFEARYAGWQPLRTVKKDGKPFKKPVIDPIERDRLLTGLWIPIRSELARNWPDRVPTTPTDLIWISKGDGICLDERWRQRAEDDATALKLLAELAHEVEELDAKNGGRRCRTGRLAGWHQTLSHQSSPIYPPMQQMPGLPDPACSGPSC